VGVIATSVRSGEELPAQAVGERCQIHGAIMAQ
jgi:hypothetical protein